MMRHALRGSHVFDVIEQIVLADLLEMSIPVGHECSLIGKCWDYGII